MQGQGDSNQTLDSILEARRSAVNGSGGKYPLFVYSYSSRGFSDLRERYAETQDIPPLHLVSLYDLHYDLIDDIGGDSDSNPALGRFLDSGGYEVYPFVDSWGIEDPASAGPWTPDLYLEAAQIQARPGDVLVSLDNPMLPIVEQVRRAMEIFDGIAVGDIRRNLLVHPNGAEPGELAQLIAAHAREIDIIGVTEKDIGIPWFLGVSYICQLRMALDATLDRYMPIHIFGCLDPRTLPYLFFAGADIFDGLSWMRYYFRDGHALYAKEIEFDAAPEILADPGQTRRALLENNVAELERLRNDLQYSVLTGDTVPFRECLDSVLAISCMTK